MRQEWKKYTFVITLMFFALGLFNILFAWLGFVCLILPFVLLAKNNRKTWCQDYCPRANLFGVIFRNRSLTGRQGPKWLTQGKVKWFVLVYFAFNLLVLTLSTIMVFSGKRAPLEKIRFLLAFELPWKIPQLLNFESFPDWAVHLSFRMYSMMLTTTVLGLLLAWIFKPRTWCTICPVNTVSDLVLNKNKK